MNPVHVPTPTDLPSRRLLAQRIAGEPAGSPEALARAMGALQAQDYQQALWALGARLPGSTAGDVERAFAEGRILRTWPMRGTLHVVPAEDAKWMLALSTPRILAGDGRRMAQLELDEGVLARCEALFADALRGRRLLPRPEMMRLLEDAGIPTRGQRGYHILWRLAQTGLLCVGPMQDKQQTFVLLDEWVPRSRTLAREEGLVELARRYFGSHGPATVADFAWWAGLTLRDARAGLEGAKAGLAEEKAGGESFWGPTALPAPGDRRPAGTYLLPGFDEYLLGYKDRSAVLPPEHANRIVPGNNGIFLPMIVVAGRIVGTWKRRFLKGAVEVSLVPFQPLEGGKEEVLAAVERYGAYFELPARAVFELAD